MASLPLREAASLYYFRSVLSVLFEWSFYDFCIHWLCGVILIWVIWTLYKSWLEQCPDEVSPTAVTVWACPQLSSGEHEQVAPCLPAARGPDSLGAAAMV